VSASDLKIKIRIDTSSHESARLDFLDAFIVWLAPIKAQCNENLRHVGFYAFDSVTRLTLKSANRGLAPKARRGVERLVLHEEQPSG